MLKITARRATGWNTWGAPTLAADRHAAFAAACESVDVNVDSKHTSVQAMFFLDGNVEKVVASPMANRSIVGSNEQIIDALGQYAATGFDEVIVPDFTLGATAEARMDAYDRFRADIIPNVSGSTFHP